MPRTLAVNQETEYNKWAYCGCPECGEWEIEFRANYKAGQELMDLAIAAWNRAPRNKPY